MWGTSDHYGGHPEAGPSRPYRRSWDQRQPEAKPRSYKRRTQTTEDNDSADAEMQRPRRAKDGGRNERRQGATSTFTSSASAATPLSSDMQLGSTQTLPPSSASDAPFATATAPSGPLSSSSSSQFLSQSASNPAPSPTSPSEQPYSSSPSASSISTRSISLYSYSRTRTLPSPSPSFVPGRTFNLTLGGEAADEAVYAVAVEMGHGAGITRRGRAQFGGISQALGQIEGRDDHVNGNGIGTGSASGNGQAVGKRQSGGSSTQTMMLQVDLGSSDMWVATTGCMSSDCRAAKLFDPSQSIDSGVEATLNYHSGSVSGNIMWEAVSLSTFSIAYQAFVAGSTVVNQNLDGGAYSGLLGLALPGNSVISQQIPGTTTNDPDGATFLDNLFGSGQYAPTQRIFSLSLGRRDDVRTSSFLTLGSVSDKYCPSPCNPNYIPIIAQPSLGATGFLHWRIPLQGIRATKWSDQSTGSGANRTDITLGPSVVTPSRNQPLAVLDSGGVAVLVGSLQYANAIYAPWGITPSSDGLYRLPCKTQLALSFQFGNQWFDAHPLDMSWPDPTDPSQATCIGAIQYTSQLGQSGDFVMGSSFLKNVYSIYSYPDPTTRGWQPTIGLSSLTNGSIASQDFYAVRYLRQSLADVSKNGPDLTGGSPSVSTASGSANGQSGGNVMNTTAIVAGSVIGFFVIAAGLFCGWWFWLRHKYGDDGKVTYKEAPERKSVASTEAGSESERRRTRKHESASRQRSMIDGYGYKDDVDEEGDTWTEGGNSVRMKSLVGVPEEDEGVDGDGGGTPLEGQGGARNGLETPKSRLLDLMDSPDPTMMGIASKGFGDGAIALPTTPEHLVRQISAAHSSHTGQGVAGDMAPFDDYPATPGSTRPLLHHHQTPDLVSPPLPLPPSAASLLSASGREGQRERDRDRSQRTSTSPQRDFSLALSNHAQVPRSSSMSMSGPFPSPLPHMGMGMRVGSPGRGAASTVEAGSNPTAGRGRGNGPGAGAGAGGIGIGIGPMPAASTRMLDNSPLYDIHTNDYFNVKPAEPGWRTRRGRSRDRDGSGEI